MSRKIAEQRRAGVGCARECGEQSGYRVGRSSRWRITFDSPKLRRSLKPNLGEFFGYIRILLASVLSVYIITKISCEAQEFNNQNRYDYHRILSNVYTSNKGQHLQSQVPTLATQGRNIKPLDRSYSAEGDHQDPISRLVSLNHKNQLHDRGASGRFGSLANGGILLPSGPPPFRPSPLALSLQSRGILEKLKGTKIFKRTYKSRAYYLFLDTLQQLTILADKVSKKKLDYAQISVNAIQAATNKLAWKGGERLKLKWPLVMLNPHFMKEILSNPTFLVMLFHAIEVAYMSMPVNFWLKPLVKLVKQPSSEKEEKTWWRRKRFYDTLNGRGSSEMQPNLKTIHFREPGEPALFAFPRTVQMVRYLAGRPPAPDPSYYSYPPSYNTPTHTISPLLEPANQPYEEPLLTAGDSGNSLDETMARPPANSLYTDDEQQHDQQYMTPGQEELFLANQVKSYPEEQSANDVATPSDHNERPAAQATSSTSANSGNQANWALELSSPSIKNEHYQFIAANSPQQSSGLGDAQPNYEPGHDWLNKHRAQLMSPEEFETLDPRQRDLVLREARRSLIEAGLTDRLIERQSKLVESFANQKDDDLMVLAASVSPSTGVRPAAGKLIARLALGRRALEKYPSSGHKLDSNSIQVMPKWYDGNRDSGGP